jgi:hypothetical protein
MKMTKTTKLSFKTFFEIDSSEFIVKQDFEKPNYQYEDADELVSEVSDFLNKFSKFLNKEYQDSIQKIEIEIVSISQKEIIEEFYDKLTLKLGYLSYFEISCSEQVKKGLNKSQIEDIDDVYFCLQDKLTEEGVIK